MISSYLRKSHLNSAIIWLGVFQMAEAPLIKTFRSGATGLILSLCNEIKLVEYINHAVTWDPKQWKVSPGQHILALVINTLCGRVPLYREEKFYEDQDVERLFGVVRTHPEKSLHVLVFIKFLYPVQRHTTTQRVDDQS